MTFPFRGWVLLFSVNLLVACGSDAVLEPTLVVEDVDSPDMSDVTDLPDALTDTTTDATPGGCTADADCNVVGGVCDPQTSACVPCLVASHCAGAQDLCIDKVCVAQLPCQSDKQCVALGQVCDVTEKVCVPCVAAADCELGQACKAHKCVDPGPACSATQACPSGQVCDTVAGSCVGCLGDTDCDPLAHCAETVCVADLCPGGTAECTSDGGLRVCADNGSAWKAQPCPQETVCVQGVCAAKVCAAGTKVCAKTGQAVETCNETGTAWSPASACPSGNLCVNGACQPLVCTPNAKKCSDQGGMEVCAADGLSAMTWFCPPSEDGKPQACTTDGGVVACKPQLCVPGTAYCENERVMLCDATGFSASQGANCTLPGPGGVSQLCLDGACKPGECTAGQQMCADVGTIATCKAGGQGYDKTACAPGTACEDKACSAVICTPGQLSCSGQQALKCSAAGTVQQPTADCGAQGKVCIDGVCWAKVCDAGAVECQGDKLATCKADGTGFTLASCAQGELCLAGACKPLVCQPGGKKCEGVKLLACSGTGTSWLQVQDCGLAGQVCDQGACTAKVCQAGEKQCQSGQLATCKDDFLGWTQAACPDKTACVAGACAAVICTPNEKACAGKFTRTCNATGTAWVMGEDCSAKALLCSAGVCTDKVCDAGTKQCQSGKLATCNADQLGWTAAACPVDTVCVGSACESVICTPGVKSCVGKLAATCNATGTALQGTEDCAAKGMVCDKGLCSAQICTPNATTCKNGTLSTCKADGTAWVDSACAGVCVADQCLPTICTPDKMACDQTFLTLCDPTGTSWIKGQNCTDLKQICIEGKCSPPVCSAGVMQCVQGDMATCLADGSGWFPTPCPVDTACVNAQCLPKVCAPNATECQTGKLATCNATGTAWTQSACGANQACSGGQCLNKICTPSAVQCQSGAVATCDATGTAWVVTDNCPSVNAICVSNKCVPVICTAGAIECQSGKAATCNATGTAWTQVSCEDGNACTTDSCSGGKCQNPNAVDNTPCGTGGSCKSGSCVLPFLPGVDAGAYGACVLTATGGMQCWGDNSHGQVGDASWTPRFAPTNVSGLTSGVTAIGAASLNTCAVLATGAVKCWGYNLNGQLGDGTNNDRNVPTPVVGAESGATQVSVGAYQACALFATGGVKCWGANTNGGVGDNTKTPRYSATQVTGLTTGVTAIAVGANHACALVAGGVKCWGNNLNGAVGDGTITDRWVPTPVSNLSSGVTAISAGSNHTCAVLKTGALVCWGSNSSGQLGDYTKNSRAVPTQVFGLASGVASVNGGVEHTCAVQTSGGVLCWGLNTYGAVGDGSTATRLAPTAVYGLSSGAAMVAAGAYHSCAWLTNGKAMCWGDNWYGAIGDGSSTQRNTPVFVKGYGG